MRKTHPSVLWHTVYKTVTEEVMPKLAGKPISFVVNQVPQPWHPQGTYVHEAALAVKATAPEAYPAYISAIVTAFEAGRFKDDVTIDMSRKQIYSELLGLLATGDDTLKAVDAAAVSSLLTLTGEGNAGTAMTQHIKWACKYHRCRGVHVTPTVHVNGLEAGIVSSGWTGEQWLKFLEPSMHPPQRLHDPTPLVTARARVPSCAQWAPIIGRARCSEGTRAAHVLDSSHDVTPVSESDRATRKTQRV